jgi:hypothetical protein
MGDVLPFRRPSPQAQEPRLTSGQLCAVLGISRSTLKRWKRNGLPFEPWSPRLHRFVLTDVLIWRRENV